MAITGATRPRDSAEMARGRENIERLFRQRLQEDDEVIAEGIAPAESADVDAFGSLIDATPHPAADTEAAGPNESEEGEADETSVSLPEKVSDEAKVKVARCRSLMPTMHADDQEEAMGLIEDVETALAEGNPAALVEASRALSEFLFFVEGR